MNILLSNIDKSENSSAFLHHVFLFFKSIDVKRSTSNGTPMVVEYTYRVKNLHVDPLRVDAKKIRGVAG